jgi:hypothetical protein
MRLERVIAASRANRLILVHAALERAGFIVLRDETSQGLATRLGYFGGTHLNELASGILNFA